MQNFKNINFYIFLACLGAALVAILAGFTPGSTVGFGFLQLSLLIISGILGGFFFRRWLFPQHFQWDWLLTALYLAGIIFAGLKPGNNFYSQPTRFLGSEVILFQDVAVNIFGFIPVGFLMMASLTNKKSIITAAIISIAIGIGTSFMIETAQYCCVPGRISSIVDLMTNSIGVFIGVISFFIYEFLRKVIA